MHNSLAIYISEEDIGKRFDVAIIEKPECTISRSQLQKLVKLLAVTVNGAVLENSSKKVQFQCEVVISLENENHLEELPIAENIPLDIIFEDEDIIVINKQSGMVCHPAPGNYSKTLVNALLWHCNSSNLSNCSGNITRPGMVHRLDKDTSGLMIIAKSNFAHGILADYFATGKGELIKRKYKCFVFGSPKLKEYTIQTFINRDPKDRQKYTTSEDFGKVAITKYTVLQTKYITSTKPISLIECELFTGRTHQIRVHMKHIKCPLIGDPIYGKMKIESVYPEEVKIFSRTALHSYYLEFKHPITQKTMFFESDFPEDLQKLKILL